MDINTGVHDGLVSTVNREAEAGRMGFYRRAQQQHLAPQWRVLHGLVVEEPVPRCLPVMWRYDEVRPYLIES